MKKLGLIGGVGPESSIEYYRLIIKQQDFVDLEILDTTKIHVEAIVAKMLED